MVELDNLNFLTQSTGKNYVHDCGVELKGAKKHLAMLKFSTEWKKAIESDPSQAYQLICKNELIGEKFKAEQLRAEGFTSEAAYAIKLLWDRVCQRPEDDPKQRDFYMLAVDELSARLSSAKNEEKFREFFNRLKDDVRSEWHNHHLHSESERQSFHFLSLGSRFKSLFLAKSRPGFYKLLEDAFSSELGKGWEWSSVSKESRKSRKENKERWIRMVPDKVIRLAQEPSGVSLPEDLITEYGFRGIQFGKWVDESAGLYHVLCSGDALADLANVLQLPRKAISFYERLGLAFGARGSGTAAAHYEPRTNVMNITKLRGGGALCHEWAHALDYNLYSYSHSFQNGQRVGLSGHKPGNHLPSAVIQTFNELMETIKEGEGRIRFAVPDPLPLEEKTYYSGVVAYLKRCGYDINAALEALKESQYRITPRMWADIGIMYCNKLKREGMEVPTEFFIPTDESYFYLDAKARGPYWKKDHELFARAFESWIEDELLEHGMTNSYLVAGTCYEGPYPQGQERESIFEAFRNWWKVLNDSGVLHDDQLWI